MKKDQFQGLIQAVTGRNFIIQTQSETLDHETEYCIWRKVSGTDRKVSFYWKTPKADEKMLRSFITAFTSKYREPDPKNYGGDYFGQKTQSWDEKSDLEKAYCYNHHASNMYSKQELLAQVEANFNNPGIYSDLMRYGFYATEYGVGIFVFFDTTYVQKAVRSMYEYLKAKSIPFSNEYSDARWVFRFKLGLSKDIHESLLNSFSI